MARNTSDFSRRQFIKLSAIGVAAVPLGGLLWQTAQAADAPMVDPNDPTAKSLLYVTDATKADPAKRKVADSACKNCMLYTGAAGAASGPCSIFPGKQVAATGWCASWVKKPG